MEELYLLLITNKASNIIEDLETLRLLSKGAVPFFLPCFILSLVCTVVPDIAGTTNNLTEEKVTQKCFELIFAFDEVYSTISVVLSDFKVCVNLQVITAGGYREPITLQQIRTNLEMDSHEEKLHNMIKISKMETARETAKDAAKQIRAKQIEDARMGRNTAGGIGGGEAPLPAISSE